jgi:hypothetical protein
MGVFSNAKENKSQNQGQVLSRKQRLCGFMNKPNQQDEHLQKKDDLFESDIKKFEILNIRI